MGDQNFEFFLPEGAQVDQGMAMTAGGQPINSSPVPEKEKNRYGFVFPLRPGETQFQVVFHLPYSGELNVDPKPLYACPAFCRDAAQDHAVCGCARRGLQGHEGPAPVRMPRCRSPRIPSQDSRWPSRFRAPARWAKPETTARAPTPAEGGASAAGRDARPGGGLGPPIDAPDPLEKYRWYILGGFAVVLAAGAIYITNRSRTASFPISGAADVRLPETPARPPASDRPDMLLEA